MDSSMDSETAALILELQLQDMNSLIKGKHRQEEGPDAEPDAELDAEPDTELDAELAAELYRAELEAMFGLATDQALSRSLGRAVISDHDVIAAHAAAEQQARHDREQALKWDTRGDTEPGCEPLATIDNEMVAKLTRLYMDEDAYPKAGESSSQAAKRTGPFHQPRRCEACHTDVSFFDVVRCPCSHEYCRDCIAEIFRASLGDESLFPPRCCRQPIPLGTNQTFLPPELVSEYQAKALEHETPNRTYCHEAACSTFVPPSSIHDSVATCVQCQSKTCTICKGPWHPLECPKDETAQQLLRVAAKRGWQRCYACHTVVELNLGCNHITCRCGAHFCYKCGAKWKTCQCSQWDENRLVDQADGMADDDAGEQAVDNAARGERENGVENDERARETRRRRRRCAQCREVHCFHGFGF